MRFTNVLIVGLLVVSGCTRHHANQAREELLRGNIKFGPEALFEHAGAGDVVVVNWLLQAKIDPNVTNNDGDTALHFAARAGATETVAALIDAGAKVDARDKSGLTPLYVAVASGRMDTAKLLTRKGADANIAAADGSTPLHLAARNGSQQMTEILLDAGAKADSEMAGGSTPLMYAAAAGSVDTVKMLLDKGASPEQRTPLDNFGPIDYALKFKHDDVARILAEKGSEPVLDEVLNTADEYTSRLKSMIDARQAEKTLKGPVAEVKTLQALPELANFAQKNGINASQAALLKGSDGSAALVLPTRSTIPTTGDMTVEATEVGKINLGGQQVPLFVEGISLDTVRAEAERVGGGIEQLYMGRMQNTLPNLADQVKYVKEGSKTQLADSDVAASVYAYELGKVRGMGFGASQMAMLATELSTCRIYQKYKPTPDMWANEFAKLFEPADMINIAGRQYFNAVRPVFCAMGSQSLGQNADQAFAQCMCGFQQMAVAAPTETLRSSVDKMLDETYPTSVASSPLNKEGESATTAH